MVTGLGSGCYAFRRPHYDRPGPIGLGVCRVEVEDKGRSRRGDAGEHRDIQVAEVTRTHLRPDGDGAIPELSGCNGTEFRREASGIGGDAVEATTECELPQLHRKCVQPGRRTSNPIQITEITGGADIPVTKK